MTTEPLLHPAASKHLPLFITAPGETDVLMVAMAVFLMLAVLMFGVVFFRLHSLPERIAHRSHKLQLEIVAVLGLISLFTHMHIFWVAGLLLAMMDLPDFGTPLNRIAGSAEKIAGLKPGEGEGELLPEAEAPSIAVAADETPHLQPRPSAPSKDADVVALPARSEGAVARKEHANA